MLKVLYAGSPEPAAVVLQVLLDACTEADAPYRIVGVLSNPPSAQGRHRALIPTPVAMVASAHCVPVLTPEHLDGACREEVASLSPDLLVCFAYGHIFGPKFLSLFPMGGVNLHPSLLPKYRGATPVPAAILNRDKETAVTAQRIALAMDEGGILAQEIIPLDGTETAGGLLQTSAQKGAALLVPLLQDAAARGALPAGTPQTGEASYTKMITKEDARIDWGKSAAQIDALIRAYTLAPGAWTKYNGETLKIVKAAPLDTPLHTTVGYSGTMTTQTSEIAMTERAVPGTVLAYQKGTGLLVQTGDGALAVTALQRQGKKAMDAASFVNGERGFIGRVLE